MGQHIHIHVSEYSLPVQLWCCYQMYGWSSLGTGPGGDASAVVTVAVQY